MLPGPSFHEFSSKHHIDFCGCNAASEHLGESQLETVYLLMLFSHVQSFIFRKHCEDGCDKTALLSRSLQTSSLPFHLAFGLASRISELQSLCQVPVVMNTGNCCSPYQHPVLVVTLN